VPLAFAIPPHKHLKIILVIIVASQAISHVTARTLGSLIPILLEPLFHSSSSKTSIGAIPATRKLQRVAMTRSLGGFSIPRLEKYQKENP
jgi:hypothetical protein